MPLACWLPHPCGNELSSLLTFDHEKIVTLAGIGCSSRFPYFVNGYGAHIIHGRAVPLASGVSLARPDLHVFLFGGDGDGFSIGGYASPARTISTTARARTST